MSLKIWLPLCDNNNMLKNLGLQPLTWITTGLNIVALGKIGGYSHYAQTAGDGLSAGPITIPANNQISICAWINFLNTARTTGYVCGFGNPTKNADFMIARHKYTGIGIYLGGTQQLIANVSTYNYNMQGWTHVAATYDGTKLRLYINGQFLKEEEITDTIQSTNYFLIGSRSTSTAGGLYGSTYADAEINDVRYYDHCLSTEEVREIANGLVLHYKLDSVNENLLYDTPKLVDSDRYLGLQLNLKENLIVGETYTLQLWDVSVTHEGKSAAEMSLGVYHGGGSISEVKFTDWDVQKDHYAYSKYLYATFTAKSGAGVSNAWLNFYNSPGSAEGTKYMHIGHWKIEKGSIATPWISSATDLTKIVDSSGYNHNGRVLNNISSSSDTIRYSTSTNLIAGNSAINCGRGGMMTDSITVNMWFKSSSWGNPVSCTENGGWNFESSGDGIRFPVYLAEVGYKVASVTTTTRTQLCNNQWHMLTGVYDRLNQKIRVYIDANLEYEDDTDSSALIGYNESNVIWIGAEASSSATAIGSNGMTGLFSDFRIYCTPLLDTDIKQLYNVSMKIDKNGNTHAGEYVENQINIFNNKNISQYCKTSHSNELVLRNGILSIIIYPADYYHNISSSESAILKNEFLPNTQYYFDIWADGDSSTSTVNTGFKINYTDGTNTEMRFIGNGNNGWQHKVLVSDKNKSIANCGEFYGTNSPVYYRLDSFVGPISNLQIKKNTQINTTTISENYQQTSFHHGGALNTKQIIER